MTTKELEELVAEFASAVRPVLEDHVVTTKSYQALSAALRKVPAHLKPPVANAPAEPVDFRYAPERMFKYVDVGDMSYMDARAAVEGRRRTVWNDGKGTKR